jgi:gas vesicle protein
MTCRIVPINSTSRVRPMNSTFTGDDWANIINVIATTGSQIYNQAAAQKAAQLNQQYQLAMQQLANANNAHEQQMAQIELEKLRMQAEIEANKALAAAGQPQLKSSPGWWSNRSSTEKAMIIGAGAVIIGATAYLLSRPKRQKRR